MQRAAWLSSVSLLVACTTAPAPPVARPTGPAVAPAAPAATKSVEPKPTVPTPAALLTPDSVAARVDNDPITIREVDKGLLAAELEIIAQAKQDPEFVEYTLAFARMRSLQDLIDTKVLLHAAEREFVVVTDAQLDEAILQIEKQNAMTRAQLVGILREQGYTLETYRAELRNQIAILKVIQLKQDASAAPEVAREALVKELRKHAKIVISIHVPKPPASVPKGAAIAAVVTLPELEKLLGRTLGRFEEGALAGQPSTATSASHHFKAVGKPESHDLAFRVWRHPPKTARDELATLQRDIGNTRPIAGLASVAFAAFEKDAKVYGVGFVDDTTSLVVLVTCGSDLCRSHDETLAIARLLSGRQAQLAGMFAKP